MVSGMMTSAKSEFFTTRTVDELLWGYEDPLLARVSATSSDVEKVFGLMYKACTAQLDFAYGLIPSCYPVTVTFTALKLF